MSKVAKGVSRQQGNIIKFGDEEKKQSPPSLNVKDTDFLLKLILESSFKGTQLEMAHGCMKKLALIHKEFLNED